MGHDVAGALHAILLAALAALLPVALLRLGAAGVRAVAPHDAEAVPALRAAGAVAGLALGLALLATTPDPAAFLPGRMLEAAAPWSLGLGRFLSDHALPGVGAGAALLDALRNPAGIGGLAAWGSAMALACGVAVATRLWNGIDALRAMAAVLLQAGLVAALLHYGLHLAGWLAARMGFWTFGLALLLFQRWRYAPRPAH
ncbi:hypothetical protein [Roseomonas sp. HF4]|uniref:hypothetical protein n=1 Tax=Roseomonas sp. HF4 TaxID=2562313 RepID=UPI0010C0132D|nr:hypothetical protein [Roseomonas sp. HF4]